jgi:hypothetical protein
MSALKPGTAFFVIIAPVPLLRWLLAEHPMQRAFDQNTIRFRVTSLNVEPERPF